MARYNTTTAIQDTNGKRYASTTIFNVPYSADDIYIKTTSYERLDMLANKFYGNVSNWDIIATANGIGKGTLWVQPDTILRIPIVTRLDDQITNINKTR
jgi:hypothetical protein